jgi:hypothetical protein
MLRVYSTVQTSIAASWVPATALTVNEAHYKTRLDLYKTNSELLNFKGVADWGAK